MTDDELSVVEDRCDAHSSPDNSVRLGNRACERGVEHIASGRTVRTTARFADVTQLQRLPHDDRAHLRRRSQSQIDAGNPRHASRCARSSHREEPDQNHLSHLRRWTEPHLDPENPLLLEEYGAHASFFVVGENVQRWPSLVQRAARDGDTIGDHTWSHPNLTNMSQSDVYIELGRDRNWITTLTGRPPTLWRPPYEAFNASDVAIATGLDMKMQLWSVDTGDWQLPGTAVIVIRVMAALHNGMVVLLHDGGGVTRSETVAAVAILIPELEAAGYRLAALPRQGIGE